MNRQEAVTALQRLAVGLEPDVAGEARLLERVSSSHDPEALRDALVELGAEALLEGQAGR